MKHSAYYTFMTYCIRHKLEDKAYLAEKVAQWENKNYFYKGEAELLLGLIEETFSESEESTETD